MITINKVCRAATVLFLSFYISGCGVMFGGSKYVASIQVKGHPDAEIYINDEMIGTGAAVGAYKRNQPLEIEVRKEGCENKTVTYPIAFRGGNFALSLVSWGIFGLAVDLGTGASYKPEHKNNPSVEKLTDKNFRFDVDYSDCSTKTAGK